MLLRVGLKIDLDEKVANLSISHKQMLEIAKTLMLDAKVIIMDEPTSSLTNKEGLAVEVKFKEPAQFTLLFEGFGLLKPGAGAGERYSVRPGRRRLEPQRQSGL
jgi:hypothetical protein